mmetsp:Transcript_59390/g.158022  ORF Transcript_59390/g.158022 Transcript_59390/m.158022 type:complete len:168 (-) Transcript_59390:707-1210(-)
MRKDVDVRQLLRRLIMRRQCGPSSPPGWTSSPVFGINSGIQYVVKEGMLRKRGLWNPGWKARYFVLDNRGRISYYDSEFKRDSVGDCSGRIALNKNCTVTLPVQDKEGWFCFDLRVPANGQNFSRTFHFSAPTEEECIEWKEVIENIKRFIFYSCFSESDTDSVRWW